MIPDFSVQFFFYFFFTFLFWDGYGPLQERGIQFTQSRGKDGLDNTWAKNPTTSGYSR